MRIPNYINTLLEKDADSKGVGGITIKPQALEILGVVDDDKLADIAKRSGSRFPKEFVFGISFKEIV